jgi:hypothetical protein
MDAPLYDLSRSQKRELLVKVAVLLGLKPLLEKEGGKSFKPCMIILPLTFAL